MNKQKEDREGEKILLNKYLAGNTSKDEVSRLMDLSKSSAELQKELEDANRILNKLDDLKLMKQLNSSVALTNVKERMKKYKEKKGWLYYAQKVAAVLFLPLLLFSIYQVFISDNNFFQASSQLAYNEVLTPSGIRSVFELPDGTSVWMNGNTKIKYPLEFNGNERRIYLEGEAYFKVAKNKKKPFIVDVGELNVQAVGTEFNCMAYPSDKSIITTLTEGSVKITRGQGDVKKGEYLLNSGEILTFELEKNQFFLRKGDLEKYVSWRSGKFVFRNDPLEVVCQKLGRWFNADIEIEDDELKNYSFTGTFKDEGLNEILELISITSPVIYKLGKREINQNNEYGELKVTIQSKN